MPALLLGFLTSNPLRTAIIAGFAALGIFTGVLLVERGVLQSRVAHKDAEIATLNAEKAALAASVDSLNLEVGLVKKSQAALEEALTAQQARAAATASIEKEIDNAPTTSDAPVAPVLRRALDRLR